MRASMYIYSYLSHFSGSVVQELTGLLNTGFFFRHYQMIYIPFSLSHGF